MIEQILCFLVLIICLVYGLALLSWLVMKLDIEKMRSKRTKFFERIGGTLMEIEKLIERLQNWDGIKPDREIDCAIEGLKALQAENDRLGRERDAAVEEIPKVCYYCKHRKGWKTCDRFNGNSEAETCTNWQWRGPKEE